MKACESPPTKEESVFQFLAFSANPRTFPEKVKKWLDKGEKLENTNLQDSYVTIGILFLRAFSYNCLA